MWIIKIIKIKCFNPPRILDEHWYIYSCLQIPPRENWFQYVRRVYTTAINFPYLSTFMILYLIPNICHFINLTFKDFKENCFYIEAFLNVLKVSLNGHEKLTQCALQTNQEKKAKFNWHYWYNFVTSLLL